LTFFGFIHGEAIGVGQSPTVAISYLGVAAILFGCAKYAAVAPKPAEMLGHETMHVAPGSAT
jgi:AGZA family xanthine/uracil permease-like MFS transporter